MTGLEALADAERAYQECQALVPILGPCTLPRPNPADYGVPQSLPDVTVTAPFPWGTALTLAVLAFLMLGGKR